MVKLSSNRIAWVYHSDNGVAYRVAAQKALTDQAKLGGEAWTVEPAKPADIKMRHITINYSGGSRTVPVYSTDAAILTEGEALNANFQDDVHAFQSSGNVIPEGHLRKSVTKDAA